MSQAASNLFPYVQGIQINDCYTYQNLPLITINGDENIPFKHFILTGRNGSGKSTTLNFLYKNLKEVIFNKKDINKEIEQKERILALQKSISEVRTWTELLKNLNSIIPNFKITALNNYINNNETKGILLTHFNSKRATKLDIVKSATRNTDISNLVINNKSSEEDFRKRLKQYLVNKKVSQAFAQLNKNLDRVKQHEAFFLNFENLLKKIFEDNQVQLVFSDEAFEFYIKLRNNQKITFNDLSDGFSAFLNIILDLLTRVEIIRGELNDYSYQPAGIVLIDEPETHLHLELQYQVLPILTALFPNIQFIVATHSPAVISSVKNVTVYDLNTQKTVADWIAGSSYSELMTSHFGLENEYSNVADEIIETTQTIIDNDNATAEEKYKALKGLFDDNQKYMSPSLRLSLEVQVLKLEKQLLDYAK
jgi:predicted ATP-binding protein involved in virulence